MNAKEERRIEFCQNLVCEFDPEAICRFWRWPAISGLTVDNITSTSEPGHINVNK
jgi:hypothetical protein